MNSETNLDKNIKLLMIIGIILYAVVLLIDIFMIAIQGSILPAGIGTQLEGKIIPYTFYSHILVLIMYGVFMLVIASNKTDSRKTAGIIMLITYVVVNLILSLSSIIMNVLVSRRGVEYLSGMNALTSYSSTIAEPFMLVSSMLILVAIGRYGISREI